MSSVVVSERLRAMRDAANALKGVDQACTLNDAKPEFVNYILTCSPAAVLDLLDRIPAVSEDDEKLAREMVSEWLHEDANIAVQMLPNSKLGVQRFTQRIASLAASQRAAGVQTEQERIRQAVEKIIDQGISDYNIDAVLQAIGKGE